MLTVEAGRFGNCSAIVNTAPMDTGIAMIKAISELPRVPKIGDHAP